MKRKDKRERKKKLKFILLPLVLGVIGIVLLAVATLFPRVQDFFTGKEDVKSAYIGRVSKQQVEEKMKDRRIEYTSIEFADEGESYKVTLEDGEVVRISSSKNISQQIDTLHGILRRLTIDNKQAKEIDLRFTRPVVKY